MKEKRRISVTILRGCIVVVAIALIGGLMYVANALVGNPISGAIAKHEIEKYLDAVYPGSEIRSGGYSFTLTSYEYCSEIDGELKYFGYHGKSKTISDRDFDSFSFEKFKEDLPGIKEKVETDTMTIDGFMNAGVCADGNYSSDYEKMTQSGSLYLFIDSTDAGVTSAQSKAAAAHATMQVLDALDASYNVRILNLIYTDRMDSYEIQLRDVPFTYAAVLEELNQAKSHGKWSATNGIGE